MSRRKEKSIENSSDNPTTGGRKKKKSAVDVLLSLIMGVCIIVIAVAGFQLFQILKNYHDSNALYENLEQSFVSDAGSSGSGEDSDTSGSTGSVGASLQNPDSAVSTEATGSAESAGSQTAADKDEKSGNDVKNGKEAASEADDENGRKTESAKKIPDADDTDWCTQRVDIAGLQAVNKDAAGWLYFEDGSISYPVMYCGDDSTYLHTAYDGSYAYAGTLFIEGKNSGTMDDSHIIIYGHNMRNLSMFGKLKNYYLDSSYYKTHQYFQIFTENMVYRYHIFAYEQVQENSFIYTVPYGDNKEFTEFINRIRSISSLSFGDEITSSDHIVTLSTCTEGSGRFVVHGVLVAKARYSFK